MKKRAKEPIETTRDAYPSDNDDGTAPEGSNGDISDSDEADSAPPSAIEPPRKRRRVLNGDSQDLEAAYFQRLEREEEKEFKQRQQERTGSVSNLESEAKDADATSSSDSEDSDQDVASEPSDDRPVHESLSRISTDADKLKRTIFLGNVSTEAIRTKAAKRILTKHLRSVLKSLQESSDKKKRVGKLESLRFRSTAYAPSSGPKKATYAKKELLEATTSGTNAYAVFTTSLAAELAAQKLNGTVVLDRHLRADWLGSPAQHNHRRCIFVGNLSFVDEESPSTDSTDRNADGTPRRPKAKTPADPEEGLWRTFGKIGTVESVRVIRDQETRVSKGFAYVQFTDENSVEKALLLNEKKFPPMLPRKLRIMRAKKTKPKAPSHGIGAEKRARRVKGGFLDSMASRKLALRRKNAGDTSGGGRVVFEGHRATSDKGTGKGKSEKSKQKHSKRPVTRSSRRGAAFKAAGGRKAQTEKRTAKASR